MILEFSGEIWFWRGPAPFYFVTVPAQESEVLTAISEEVTYGWGMIPVIYWGNRVEHLSVAQGRRVYCAPERNGAHREKTGRRGYRLHPDDGA
ncbi:MAG: DUF1905 domain-containing protein [Anaerolineales bacterium]